jgi:hypothetical protein
MALHDMAFAKNLYVNNSGSPACNNATTYANNDASNPWCHIARAAWGSTTYSSPNTGEAAQAGDVVLVTAGTYWESGNTTTGTRYSVALNPANSGTAGNLITFRGVGTVEIRLNDTVRGPMIGANERNYIVWDNFTVNDYYGGSVNDTGPVMFGTSTGSQLINSTIAGHTGSYYWGYSTYGGNYGLIRLDFSDTVLIKNNYVHRVHLDDTGIGGRNEACIMTYNTSNSIIEHNEVYDCGTGIYIKGVAPGTPDYQRDNIVRYNLLYENFSAGIDVTDSEDTLVHQNIVYGGVNTDNNSTGAGQGSRPTPVVVNPVFINNTFVDNNIGFATGIGVVTGIFKNNIISGGRLGVFTGSCNFMPSSWDVTLDRNLYYNYSTAYGNVDCSGNFTFATMQGTYSQEPNSVNAQDPLFTNAAGHNYHLQAGSPALTLGRVVSSIGGSNGDTIPAGAYITGNETIGVESNTNARIFNPRLNLIRSSLPQHTEEMN